MAYNEELMRSILGRIFESSRGAELYKSNYAFRVGMGRVMSGLSNRTNDPFNVGLADLYSKFNIDNDFRIRFGPTGESFNTMEEALKVAGSNQTLRSIRSYGADLFDAVAYESNEIANKVFGGKGFKTKIESYNVRSAAELEVFNRTYSTFGGGLIRPKKGVNDVMRVFRSDGVELTTEQILSEVFESTSLEPEMIKRMAFLFSNRGMVLSGVSDDLMPKVHLFDHEAMLKRIMGDKQFAGLQSMFTGDQMENAFSGMNFMTRSGHQRLLTQMRQEAMRDRAKGGAWAELADRRIALIDQQLKNSSGGYYLNMQGGRTANGRVLEGMKSDVAVMSQAQEEQMRSLLGLSEKEFNELTFITSRKDVKESLRTKFGFVSLDPRSPARTGVRGNLFATGTLQDIIAEEGFLDRSTMTEMTKHLDDLKAGKVSGGLIATLKEIAEEKLSEEDLMRMGAAEQAEFVKSQEFAKRVIGMFESGTDVGNIDSVMMQISNSLKKHYTRLRKGKAGATLEHRNAMGPYYEMSSLVHGGFRAHVIPSTAADTLPNRISLDAATGRLKLATVDNLMYYAAHGGSDFDDEFMAYQLAYDPKTKRLMAPLVRDPLEMGEFRYADVEMGTFASNRAFDSLVPDSIRQMHGELEKLNDSLRIESRKMGKLTEAEEREVLNIAKKRDSLVRELRNFYEGRSVRIRNGKKLETMEADAVREATAHIRRLDLAKIFDPDGPFFAPKGFRRTTAAAKNYEQLSFSRSLATEAELTGVRRGTRMTASERVANIFNVVRGDAAFDEANRFAGRMPYEFVGSDFSEFHSIYYPGKTIKPSGIDDDVRKLQRLQRRLENGEFVNPQHLTEYQAFMTDRLITESKHVHDLGKAANAQTALDAIMQSHLQTLTPESRKIFLSEWEKAHMQTAARENIIDASVKTGDTTFLEAVDQMITGRYRSLGETIARTRQAMGNSAETVGIDPLIYHRLISSNRGGTEALAAGWKSVMGADADALGFLLSPDDPKSWFSRAYDRVLAHKKFWEDNEKEIAKNARDRHLAEMSAAGLEFTPEEMSRGSELLQQAFQAQAAGNKFFDRDIQSLAEDMERIATTGETLAFDPSAEIVRGMHGLGLFAETAGENGKVLLTATEASRRQILAMSQILAENGVDQRILENFGEGVNAMNSGDMLRDAIQHLVTTRNIPRYSASQLLDSVSIVDGEMRSKIPGTADMQDEIYVRAKSLLTDEAENLSAHQTRGLTDIVNLIENRRYIQEGNVFTREAPVYGTRRYALREEADVVADTVTRRGKKPLEMMRMFDREGFRELMEHPMAKRSLIGAGALVGFGILYRLTHDPTPEEMQGPPLLPDGNPYDNVDMASSASMSSLFPKYGANSAQGMLYQIRASGNFDAPQLHSAIESSTGMSTKSLIHQSRKTRSYNQNSRSRLNGIMGA